VQGQRGWSALVLQISTPLQVRVRRRGRGQKGAAPVQTGRSLRAMWLQGREPAALQIRAPLRVRARRRGWERVLAA